MRTYQIEYNPEENKGVYALSVVKSPAMESKFITLKDDQKAVKLATVSDERRILLGASLIPNKDIYRNDPEHGEYNIRFSAETIESIAHDFIRRGNSNNSTIEHTLDLGSDAVSVVESWIIEDAEHDKSRKYGFSEPVGTWMSMMKVHDDAIWKMAKAGEIEGFSIDGIFNLNEIKMSEQKTTSKWEEFKAFFAEDKPKPSPEVKLGEVKSADGSVTFEFEGEVLETGVNVAIVTEEGKTALPVGSYDLEEGKVLVIEEDGIVASVSDAAAAEEEEGEVEMSDEDKKLGELLDAIMGLNAQLKEVKTDLAAIKEQPASEGIKPKATKLSVDKQTEKKGMTTAAKLFAHLQENRK